MEPWELVAERDGGAGFLRVTTRHYRLPDGREVDWDVVGSEATVAVVALTADRRVVLARQFRPGPGCILDELPGGIVEPGEDLAAAGERELREETGYDGRVTVVGSTWLAASSRTRRYVGVALGVERVGDPEPDPGELCEPVVVGLATFRSRLRAGALTDVDLAYIALDVLGLLGPEPGDAGRV